MHSGLKTLTWWWLAAMIGICLAAGSAEARDKTKERQRALQERTQCEDQCTKANEEKVQACIKSCPLPRRGNTEEYQACSRRCVSSASIQPCSQRCEQVGKDTKKREPRRYKKRNPSYPDS